MDILRLSRLIDSLYQAALQPEDWGGVAARFAETFDSHSCAIQLRDIEAGRTMILSNTANYAARDIENYERHYHATDLYVSGAMRLGVGVPLVGAEVVADRTLLHSEYYVDWLKGVGIFHLAGAMLPVGPGILGGIGIHRPYGARAFEAEHKEMLRLLLPHLIRALQLQQRLGGAERRARAGFQALDHLSIAALLVDGDGRVIHANEMAEALLAAGQGIAIRSGRLHVPAARRHAELQKAIRDASRQPGGRSVSAGGIISLPRQQGAPLSLMVAPLPAEHGAPDFARAAALVFIQDPDAAPVPPEAALMAAFRFTPAEARLAAALAAGQRLEDYAASASVSLHTVKTQLKQVFAKADVSRQTDLVRVILANPLLRVARG